MAFLHHGRQYGLRYDEGSVQVDVDYAAEIGCFHLVHRHAADDTGIVYKDVNCTYFFFNLGNHSLYCRFVGNVAHITMYLDTLLSVCGQTFIYQFLIDIVEANSCTLFCKSRSDGKTDTVRSTCNEGYFTFQ